jgi:opacity protein-like surface antigen
MDTRTLTLAALAALASSTAIADDGWYGGVQFGNASTSEEFAPAPLPTAAPVSYSVCGGTATLTPVGFPQVTNLDASASAYQFFVGRRFGSWGFEIGAFNVARLEDKATAPATATQPVCNPASNLVIEGEQVGLVSYAFEGFAFTPVYSIPFGEGDRWMVDVRATIAFWDGEERSQYQMVATERNTAGEFLQQYPVAIENGDGSTHGVDLGVGLGLSYQLKEKVRVRGIYEQQAFGDFVVQSWLLGVAIDFP